MEEILPSIINQSDEKQYWSAHKSANGLTYYFNTKTQKSQWYKPACLMSTDEQLTQSDWQEITTTDGKIFYYNSKTKKSSWKLPDELRLARSQQAEKARQFGQLDGKLDQGKQREKTEEELKKEQIKAFKELLKEQKISQSYKWDQVQQMLQNEERYQNIKQIGEKKRLFYEYIEELKEKVEMEAQNKQAKEFKDFNKMLEEAGLKSDAKYYKCSGNFAKDPRFKSIEEKTREMYFQDYLDQLYKQEKKESELKRQQNSEILKQKFVKLELGVDYTWDECCKLMKDDPTWNNLLEYDRITVFSNYIQELQDKEYDDKKKIRKSTERQNRFEFKELLKEKIVSGDLNSKTKWKDFVQKIKDSNKFLNMLGQYGSTPHELFEDQIDTLIECHQHYKSEIKTYMKQIGVQITSDMSFQEFYLRLQMFNVFNELEHHIKMYFYHYFISKAKQKEKENQKKLKKQTKKFQKMIKNLSLPSKASIYDEAIEKLIEQEIASKYEILQSLTKEQKKQMFEDYINKKKAKNEESGNESNEESRKLKKSHKKSKDDIKDQEKKIEKKIKTEQESSSEQEDALNFKPQIFIEESKLQTNPLLAALTEEQQKLQLQQQQQQQQQQQAKQDLKKGGSTDKKDSSHENKHSHKSQSHKKQSKEQKKDEGDKKASKKNKSEEDNNKETNDEEGEINEEGEIKEENKKNSQSQHSEKKKKKNSTNKDQNDDYDNEEEDDNDNSEKHKHKKKDKKHKKKKEKEEKKSRRNKDDSSEKSD